MICDGRQAADDELPAAPALVFVVILPRFSHRGWRIGAAPFSRGSWSDIDTYNVMRFRVCFVWTEDGPDRVAVTDYH